MLSKLKQYLLVTSILALTATLSGQQIDWQTDLDQAKQAAARDGKLILLHFYADWCGPCQQLDTFVFNRESVGRAIEEGMVPVKVDIDVHPDLVSEYGVKSIPFDVIISPNGNMVHRQKSPSTTDNYQSMITRLSKANRGTGTESISPSIFKEQIASQEAKPTAEGSDSMQFNATSVDFRPTEEHTKVASSDGQFRPRSTSGPSTTARTTGTLDFVSNTHVQPNRTTDDFSANAALEAPKKNSQVQPGFSPRPKRIVNEIAASSMRQNNDDKPVFSPGSIRTQPKDIRATIRTGSPEMARQEIVAAQPQQPIAALRVTNDQPARPAPPKPKTSFALNANCPVSLLTISKWVPGNENFGCVHRGKTYLFASKEHMETFLAAPDKYSPVLAGFDPVSFSENGEFHDGEESLGVFMSKGGVQKIVLFKSMDNRNKFQQDPKRYLEAVRVATETLDASGTITR